MQTTTELKTSNPTFEYHVCHTNFKRNYGQIKKELDDLGAQEWELVSCLPPSPEGEVRMIFKRQAE